MEQIRKEIIQMEKENRESMLEIGESLKRSMVNLNMPIEVEKEFNENLDRLRSENATQKSHDRSTDFTGNIHEI